MRVLYQCIPGALILEENWALVLYIFYTNAKDPGFNMEADALFKKSVKFYFTEGGLLLYNKFC